MTQTDKTWKLFDYIKLIPVIIVGATIVYYSSLSNPFPIPPPGDGLPLNINSILHVCEFALFSFCLTFGFFDIIKGAYLFIIATSFAILDEIHQYFVPNRYFDVYDIILDSIGVVLGILFFLLIINLKNRLKKDFNKVIME